MTKNVLIISYHFPPDLAVGAIRPAEFARFLPEYGWSPIVLTVRQKYYEHIDPARYNDLKSISINRTVQIPYVNDILVTIYRSYLRIRKPESSFSIRERWIPHEARQGKKQEGLKFNLMRYFNSLFVYLPDKQVGWIMPAVLKAVALNRTTKIDALLTTGPPHSVHLIGLVLKFLLGICWVSDFRDPWAPEMKQMRIRSYFSVIIEQWMRRMVVRKSDCVVSVTSEMTQRLKDMYPGNWNKFHTIHNGFDSEALSKYRNVTSYERFTITYVGSFYFGRTPYIFLRTMSNLIKDGHIDPKGVQIRFIGDCRYSDGKSVEKMVEETALKDVVKFVDQIPHDEALREIAMSDAVLLMAPNQPLQIPGKVFEYIGLRSVILSVCGDGATKSLLKNYPYAYIVSPDNMSEMKDAIMKLLQEKSEEGARKVWNPSFEQYERGTLVRKIAHLMEKYDLSRALQEKMW